MIKPQDPHNPGLNPDEVQQRVREVLSRDAVSLSEEAGHLEEAYRILNAALS